MRNTFSVGRQCHIDVCWSPELLGTLLKVTSFCEKYYYHLCLIMMIVFDLTRQSQISNVTFTFFRSLYLLLFRPSGQVRVSVSWWLVKFFVIRVGWGEVHLRSSLWPVKMCMKWMNSQLAAFSPAMAISIEADLKTSVSWK